MPWGPTSTTAWTPLPCGWIVRVRQPPPEGRVVPFGPVPVPLGHARARDPDLADHPARAGAQGGGIGDGDALVSIVGIVEQLRAAADQRPTFVPRLALHDLVP